MKCRAPQFILGILLATGAAAQLQSQSAPTLDSGFKDRSMAHVVRLASLGTREAGSKIEKGAARYIEKEMKKAGLSVAEEPFTFQSFTLVDAVLVAGGEKAAIVRLGFDPYSATAPISGELVRVNAADRSSLLQMDLDGKIVLIAGTDDFNRISFFKKAKAIVCLSSADFERLKGTGAKFGEIRTRGKLHTKHSRNIVGVVGGKPGSREIIVSAHYDSFAGPGANDNASGVGIILELARYFRSVKLPPNVSMHFVAFGGEEFGFLGSKAYLRQHQTELRNCELLFNIDQVGGDGAIYTDTRGGVRGVPGKFGSQLPEGFSDKATTDAGARWRLPLSVERPLWDTSDVPEWLRTAVSTAGTDLGRKVVASNGAGSDHRVFVQAGVVATDITIEGGAKTHAPTDRPEGVHADSMELAARIVAGVIQDLLRSEGK